MIWWGTACRPPGAPVTPAASGTAALEVEALAAGPDGARVAFALFDSAETFRAGEPARKAFVELRDGASVWALADLPVADYAVKAYLDRDGDGVLGYDRVGAPAEPYGFSNDARGRLGPPGWERARFELPAGGRRITISLR